MSAEAVVAGHGEGSYETIRDALAVTAATVRAHANKLDAVEHLGMYAAEWETLADKLEEASLRPWLDSGILFEGPDEQKWGARWK